LERIKEMRGVRSMGFFLVQIGIFVLLLAGIGLSSKVLGKYSFYFLLTLTLTALTFTILNTNDISDRPFLFVMLFGIVCLVSIIKLMIKKA
jgi:hypothetical protein